MRKLILVSILSVLLLGAGTAMADTILFPYLNTDPGVYSFVTIANNGTNEYAAIAQYHLIYGYKANPIVNKAGCGHSDHNVLTTPADMMTFEINGKVDDAGNDVLFENAGDALGPVAGGLTSTAWLLNVSGQTAFLVVEPVGIGALEFNDNVVRMWGWADVIDTANNMSLTYSTQNFVNDLTGTSFTNVGAPIITLSWYPAAFVSTSWHILPLDTALNMSPAATPGGLRAALLAWDGTAATTGAYNRDEVFTSGAKRIPIRCFGVVTRNDMLEANGINESANGGWAHLESADANITLLANDSVDPGGIYTNTNPNTFANWSLLVHRIQTATAAAGVGVRTGINREPQFNGFPFAP